MRKFRIVSITGILLVFLYLGVQSTKLIHHQGASSVWWLPESATNIYSKNSLSFKLSEFSIPENEFVNWASEQQLQISPLKSISPEIFTYKYYFGDQESKRIEAEECMSYIKRKDATIDVGKCLNEASGIHVATQGYFGEEREPSHRGYTVLYDSSQRKAYYIWASH